MKPKSIDLIKEALNQIEQGYQVHINFIDDDLMRSGAVFFKDNIPPRMRYPDVKTLGVKEVLQEAAKDIERLSAIKESAELLRLKLDRVYSVAREMIMSGNVIGAAVWNDKLKSAISSTKH